jgi:hypothetical protein
MKTMRFFFTGFFLLITIATYAQTQAIPFNRSGQWGLVERGMGRGLITPRYKFLSPLLPGYFHVRTSDKNSLIITDTIGNITLNMDNTDWELKPGGVFFVPGKGYYWPNGKKIEAGKEDVYRMLSASEGRIRFVNHKHKTGFLDSNGKVIIKPEYKSAGDFKEGVASVCTSGKCGLIDIMGRKRIDFLYDSISILGENRYAAWLKGKAALITDANIPLTGFEFERIGPFSEGLSVVCRDGSWMYLNKMGKNEFRTLYSQAGSFINGMAVVMNDMQYQIISRQNQLYYTAPANQRITRNMEGLFFEVFDSKLRNYFAINNLGRVLWNNEKVPFMPSGSRMLIVSKGNLYGIINETGYEAWPVSFDFIRYDPLTEAWFVISGSISGYIDAQGNKYWRE